MNSQKFYTTGCGGKNSSNLLALLERRDAVLADIRLSANAADEEFAPARLEKLIGRKYHRVTQLGSRSMRVGEKSIAHLALGLKIIRSWEISVVLMCECREFKECHRSLIAKELGRLNLPVEEITDWSEDTANQSQPLHELNQLPDIQKSNKQIKSHRMESVAEIALNSEIISIQCGTPEEIVTREVAALVSGGLAIHEDANQPNLYAVTHLASGRRICSAESRVHRTLILSALLKLKVDWTLAVPWQTEAEAVRLKQEIKNIMARAVRN